MNVELRYRLGNHDLIYPADVLFHSISISISISLLARLILEII